VSDGDMAGLIELLAPNATLVSDGGGKVAAARNPIHGADRVARLFLGVIKKMPPGFFIRPARVNGGTGMVLYDGARPYGVFTAEVADGRIQSIQVVVNPDKLCRVPPP
jgi:RNA polymerase sigma-70 factor (ECF subfamily)